MQLQTIVQELRTPYPNNIPMNLSILDTCILCKKFMSSQKWSGLLERKVKNLFNLQTTNILNGDAMGMNDKTVEIKISLGSGNTFNFVQIRPDHNVDYFLFLSYDVMYGNLGKCYWMCIPKEHIIVLLQKYGSYAHGSKKVHGPITDVSIKHNKYEYALRPSIYSNGKSRLLWNEMMQYIVDEEYIYNLFNKID